MNVKASLQRKIGPLRAWQWLGLVAVAVLGWRYLHPAQPAPAAATSTLPSDVGAGAGFGAAGSGGAGSLGLPDTTTAAPLPDSGFDGGGGTPVLFDPTTNGYPETGPLDPVSQAQEDAAIMALVNEVQAGLLDPSALDPYADPTTSAGRAALYAAQEARDRAAGIVNPAKPTIGGRVAHPTEQSPGGYIPKSKPKPKAKTHPATAKATKPARPSSSRGRVQPRKPTTSTPAHAAPRRKPAPAPVVARHTPAPTPTKKRKAVLRPTAQQAHNHGEPAPARSRAAASQPQPTRVTAQVAAPRADAVSRYLGNQAPPLPARAAPAPPVPPAQLAAGERPLAGRVYAA